MKAAVVTKHGSPDRFELQELPTPTPGPGEVCIRVSKAGIIQMSKYFAVHLAERNIRCNSVSPGGIFNPENPQGKDFISKYSDRCPMKRMAKSEEIIGAIVYLSSDLASYTTGQNITVDGGTSAW